MTSWSDDDGFCIEDPKKDYLKDVLARRKLSQDSNDGTDLALRRLLRATGTEVPHRKQDAR